jgi:hypothetical protein
LGSLRREGRILCRPNTLFCHLFLPYRLEAGLPREIHIAQVDIHHALTYRQDMLSSLRVAAQCCRRLLRRVRLEHPRC